MSKPGLPSGPVRSVRTRSVMPSSVNSILSKCSGEKSSTQNELLSAGVNVEGSGMLLCSGPLTAASPGLQVVAPKYSGTITSEKSSLAASLNSTRIVRSLASWVWLAPLY